MDKFSKVQKDKEERDYLELYNSNYLTVLNYNNNEIISENDTVAILPYFIHEGFVLMLSEYIQAYQYKYKENSKFKDKTNYISVITGSIEENESIEKAIRRELYEEGGVAINSLYNINYIGPFFKNKNNSSQVYLCLLELGVNDYKQTKPPTDGSISEKLSKPVKISIGDIDEIRVQDLYTQTLFSMLKKEYDL